MSRTVLALRHLAFEDLGQLAPLLQQQGWDIRYHEVGVDDLGAIDLAQVGLLAVLGGPISAEDDARYPFLADEVRLLRERLATRRPLLGICLGAQLIARALGARVRPMGHKEIGYGPLSLTTAGQASPLSALEGRPVLHWHGDQFDLPAGIPSLAATPLCPHQAFQLEGHTLAWQFHPEADPARLESWLLGHAVELAQAGIAPQQLRAQAKAHGAAAAPALQQVMQRWLP